MNFRSDPKDSEKYIAVVTVQANGRNIQLADQWAGAQRLLTQPNSAKHSQTVVCRLALIMAATYSVSDKVGQALRKAHSPLQ